MSARPSWSSTTASAAAAEPSSQRQTDHGKNRQRSGEKEKRPGLRTVGPSVLHALQANAALRALSGFLIFFLAFLLREQPLAGLSAAVSLGIVGVAAGVGNALGTAVGAWLRARGPEVIIAAVLGLALGVAVLAAVFYRTADGRRAQRRWRASPRRWPSCRWTRMIQRDVPEEVRTSAFARSETLLQMSWVVGGAHRHLAAPQRRAGDGGGRRSSADACAVGAARRGSARGLLSAARG